MSARRRAAIFRSRPKRLARQEHSAAAVEAAADLEPTLQHHVALLVGAERLRPGTFREHELSIHDRGEHRQLGLAVEVEESVVPGARHGSSGGADEGAVPLPAHEEALIDEPAERLLRGAKAQAERRAELAFAGDSCTGRQLAGLNRGDDRLAQPRVLRQCREAGAEAGKHRTGDGFHRPSLGRPLGEVNSIEAL